MNFLRQALAVAAKVLRSEIRSKESIHGSVAFALVLLLLLFGSGYVGGFNSLLPNITKTLFRLTPMEAGAYGSP